MLSLESAKFCQELSSAAQSYVGKPFVNHAAVANCGSRKTLEVCMDIGMGPEGYDCSGLVIRAMGDVLGRSDSEWAYGIRHVAQMVKEATHISAEELTEESTATGLLYVFSHNAEGFFVPAAHVGIYIGGGRMVHARSRGFDMVANEKTRVAGTSKRFAYALNPASLVGL